ncbi:MAG: hypothetical protein RJA36_150 [Pseudomonadota bacterium]
MRRAVVTRPAGEASGWAAALGERGWAVAELPLIEIAAPAESESLQRARACCRDYHALMFVSAAAVAHFFAGRHWGDFGSGARCWAPGPATARALQAAGVPPERIDAPASDAENFDSESLWQQVGAQVGPGHRLLVVRGQTEGSGEGASMRGNGRDWLASQCEQRGGQVDWCVAYRRRPPCWSAGQLELARAAAADGSVWLLSSSEAVANLRTLLPEVDWTHARALVTHPRIAEAAGWLGFGATIISRASLTEVLRNLESMP